MNLENINKTDLFLKQVAGVIVLYNPTSEVYENILSYLDQVDILFAVDNSDVNSDFNRTYLQNAKIKYLPQNQNLGIAFALNIAAHKAYQLGYTFLLTMDQDSKAPPEMVYKLLCDIEDFSDVGIVSPFHLNGYNFHEINNTLKKVASVRASGNILNLSIFHLIGGFNEEYFIDYVDIEYGFRLNSKGFKVLLNNSVPLVHREANIKRVKFLWTNVYIFNHAPIRIYYKFRNLHFLRKEYKKTFPKFYMYELTNQLKMLIKVIIYEKQKLNKFKWAIRGVLDYFRNQRGKCSFS